MTDKQFSELVKALVDIKSALNRVTFAINSAVVILFVALWLYFGK